MFFGHKRCLEVIDEAQRTFIMLRGCCNYWEGAILLGSYLEHLENVNYACKLLDLFRKQPISLIGCQECLESTHGAHWSLGMLVNHPMCLLVTNCAWKTPTMIIG
jgi:hypothetical protein